MSSHSIKTVHMIGLGAIGCTYGSLLYKNDKSSVKVVIDEGRMERYKKGTVINGERYYFDLTIPKPDSEKAEFILIAVKNHQLKRVIEMIAPLIGEDTVILSLLNGITSEDELSRAFGRNKVLHGFCVATDAVRENGEVHFVNSGKIVFGENYAEVSGKAASVAEFFTRAGIAYEIPQDIRREMWWKFMMNVGINQTSAILRAPYGVYQSIPEARELFASACREVIPIARAKGINLSEDDIKEYIKILKKMSPTGKTSMLQDVEAGRKTEVECFALTVMNLGKKYGIPTPVNETLYRLIRVIEQK